MRSIAWLVAMSALAGCNAVLGIREPVADNLLWDAGQVAEEAQTDDAEPTQTTPGAKTGTAGQGSATGAVSTQGSSLPAADDPRWAQWRIANPKSTNLPIVQSYHLEDNDLVTDQVTHLQWQSIVDEKLYTWEEATAYCDNFSIPGGPFRLPTRIELITLVDFTLPIPTIDAQSFPDTPPNFFWTSSTYVVDKKAAWIVNFGPGAGFVSSSDQSSKYHVRCVRQTNPT